MAHDLPVVLDLTGRDIHAEADRLRANGPLAQLELPGGIRAWSVTGYALARQVLADERFSKDARQHWPAYAEGKIGPEFPLIAWARMENLTTAHGPEHARQRSLIIKAFSPRRVQLMRPAIERAVNGLLDALAQAPGPVVDLKAGFAHPLAATVIGDLIGVPAAERVEILGGAGYAAGDAPTTPDEAAAAFARLRARMTALVEAKRREPGDDLASDLLAVGEADTRMTAEEIVSTLLLLLNTGTEPAMNLITNAVTALLTHPDQRDRVRTGQVSWAAVIEETLRVEAPVAHLPFRFAIEDVEIDGITIPRGEPILMNFAAIGRDPAVHGEHADRFDPARPNKQHLSFGHGLHRCLGSALAWLEVEIALAGLFGRFPDMTLAVAPGDLVPSHNFAMNGSRSLPVTLGPARPVA
jgi:cytochrome P450